MKNDDNTRAAFWPANTIKIIALVLCFSSLAVIAAARFLPLSSDARETGAIKKAVPANAERPTASETDKPDQLDAPAELAQAVMPDPSSATPSDSGADLPKRAVKKEAPSPPTIRIASAGDIMMQRKCNRSAAQKSKGDENNFGYDGLFPGLADAFTDSDVVLGNLELPVFEKMKPERSMVFNAPPALLHALKKAGFTLLTAANNHAYDHGRISPESTYMHCTLSGIPCLGVGPSREEAEKPYVVGPPEMRIAVIGYSTLANSNLNRSDPAVARVNGYGYDDLIGQVKECAAKYDGVVVEVHWGVEYTTSPIGSQKVRAKQLVEAGASLVFGHHPHVLEPIVPMTASDGRRALVAYSLGNFITNQGGRSLSSTTRLGNVLKVDLTRTEKGVEVTSWDSMPSWVHNKTAVVDGKRVEDVHVQICDLEIWKLEKKLAKEQDESAKKSIQREIQFYRDRIKQAENILINPSGPKAKDVARASDSSAPGK